MDAPHRDLSSELDEANAELARLHVEHEALWKDLGEKGPPPTEVPRSVKGPEASGAAYRDKDKGLELEHALRRARKAIAALREENELLAERARTAKLWKEPVGTRPIGLIVLTLIGLALCAGGRLLRQLGA
jgi:hypothetical protein